MKTPQLFSALVCAFFLSAMAAAQTSVITNNTAISLLNTSYDGTDIVVSNCTVTVDGAHSFNSLLVGAGGVLTHSASTSGNITVSVSVTNESQILDAYFPATLLNTNVQGLVVVTDANSGVVYSNGVDYIQTDLANGTTQIYATTNSAIPGYAVVLVSYTWAYSFNCGLYLNVTNNVNVANGGSLNVNGQGCSYPYVYPGRGNSSYSWYINGVNIFDGSGAGHGGGGGMSSSNALGGACYDSLYQPTSPGSGGGPSYTGNGGNGGGVIQITAGGTVNIDGTVSASGAEATNSRAGGGSGGSIWMVATNFSGAGSLSANGGAGEPTHGGGGGGGRISIQCGTNLFTGSLTAYGGPGWQTGGAGTVFIQTNGQTGLLVVDNGGQAGTNTTVNLATTADAVISGGASVQPSGSFLPRNLTIATNSTLTGYAQNNLNFNVSGNLTVQPGGTINVSSLGYAADAGNAPGTFYTSSPFYQCSGGGHGGYGGAAFTNASGGATYDSQSSPASFGSGGGTYSTSIGGPGGGVLQLSVSGTLQVDGRISADGGSGSGTGGGGGSGGSININCTAFSGGGSVTANGGSGVASIGGGGGGGRIAVAANTSGFAGTISAYGGGGANYGGAGTIFTQIGAAQQLLLDNGGNLGTNTLVASASLANLVVQNGARATASGSATFNNLLVATNGWLTHTPASSLNLTISGNATIQSGGGFIGDFLGRAAGQGGGTGGSYIYAPLDPCGGGGYAGRGGNSYTNAAAGGVGGGDTAAFPSPTYSGSGGGTSGTTSVGGSGGGFLQMTVNGILQLNGLLTANGGAASGLGGGGGAGGGVYLTVGTLAGGGGVSVNGGAGANAAGGGGGGGRIAVYFNTINFSGTLSAFGGAGANYGSAGTIYLKTNSAAHAQVIVDNAGHAGAATTWNSSSTADLMLRNGSSCYLPFGVSSFGNLIIGTNSWLYASNGSPSSVTINAVNVTVQPSGGISADFSGYSAGSGINSGAGGNNPTAPYFPCGGGGHGGYGGMAMGGLATGGNYNDNAASPSYAGSGGGSYSTYSTGGKGGGVLFLTLSGNLQVDGSLSAGGANGSGVGGGGGAGGTLNLSCGTLAGAGRIAVNGGNGVAAIGGAGAGGMVYAKFTANLFSGTISAYGGSGAVYGGAGTIYFQTNSGQSSLIVDNGGQHGPTMYTPLATANNIIIRNGVYAFPVSSGQSINSLLIASNGWLVSDSSTYPGTINYTVTGNATIQSGGGVYTDAAGSAQNLGTGHGVSYYSSPFYPCGGGGHAGYGASGYSGLGGGGAAYDSTASPTSGGSGGGGYATYSVGGNGGGYVRLMVNGTLQLDGSITANGGSGSGDGGGGGSGGAIYLAPGTLAGAGSISANGGSGAPYGGGGGGGRIAVYFNNNNFTGNLSAFGGGGFAYGGAGTIYLKTNSANYGMLLLDNANNPGTNTVFDFNDMDVTMQNGAIGQLPSSGGWTAHNIMIHTNGTLAGPGSSSSSIVVSANNVTIDAGGALSMDSAGYGSQSGPGLGYWATNPRGGGGHGGFGGGNSLNYGAAYDSILSPNTSGSGGASNNEYPPYDQGGAGGGALKLSVSGLLTVNGRLSANGGNGDSVAGGGSGGSLYLYTIKQLTGNGVIAANGGAGGEEAGGGGGGRIALYCNSNTFTGQLSAFGGGGIFPGGAGTIFTTNNGVQSLTINNGGIAGTNTPIGGSIALPGTPFDLTISGAASVVPVLPLPLLNNFTLATNSTLLLTAPATQLVIAARQNVNLAGNLAVDFLGYAQTSGPGAGGTISSQGAGGGYGGGGGNSASGAPGGTNYGSISQPVDFGSGGGAGADTITGGSEGGGAIRITAGGTLNLTGTLSANGDDGWQDSSGGGAGGSMWLSANTLTGLGTISATGGNGDLWNGGGGGGGRIAVYSPTNLFAGVTNVSGGLGWLNGQSGTIFLSTTPLVFLVSSQSPTGVVNNIVSYVDLLFNEAVDPASVTAAAFSLTTPAGVMNASNLSATALSGVANDVRVSFPVQNLPGNYALQTAPLLLTNILGVPLAQAFTGNFTITLPVISGLVADTNGAPVTGVTMQPNGGLPAATTDTNGNYSIGVPPGWNGAITPTYGSYVFVPGTINYTNVAASLTNQNYLMVTTIVPSLTTSLVGTNLSLAWPGIAGVTYQAWSSTDLINWALYGNAIAGANGPLQILVPLTNSPAAFFRIGAAN